MKDILKLALGLCLLIGTLSSCQKEEVAAEPTINDWLYNIMKEVYYWTDEIPTNVDRSLTPERFFESLLSVEDRFSAIVPDYNDLINQLNGVTLDPGYEIALLRKSADSDELIALILYVKENSSADNANLRRGDIITAINGNGITEENYITLFNSINTSHAITYDRYNDNISEYEAFEANIVPFQLAENPHYLDTIYTTDNGRKIGYYVYNFFAPGTDGNAEYEQQLENIFASFKNQNVEELIVDLRYNNGGFVSSATHMASLIAPSVNNTDIFYENRWNDLYQDYIEGRDDGDDILRGKFSDLPENIGDNLTSAKIYVLTGSRTASASELIINGLRPYMNVEIIGDTTVGKNVGSIPIDDEDNPNNDYGILPIVFKIFNSAGESNYSAGFIPAIDNLISDFQLPLRQLGDVNEPLLERALSHIEASSTGGRKTALFDMGDQAVFFSLDRKFRNQRLIEDTNNIVKN